jgi:hypothetical protein
MADIIAKMQAASVGWKGEDGGCTVASTHQQVSLPDTFANVVERKVDVSGAVVALRATKEE